MPSRKESLKKAWTEGKFANRYKMPAKERFETHIKKLDDGCWMWTGKINKNTGYGQHGVYKNAIRKDYLAHRYSYELYIGKMPNGFCIDHLCRNRWCVNPDHLEPTTLKENVLRGIGVCAINHQKIHCIHGHLLSGKNLYITPDNRRQCKVCNYNRTIKHLRRAM